MTSLSPARLLPAAFVCLLVGATGTSRATTSLGWGEPHLSTIPRSLEEAGRVAAASAQPEDFSGAEPYEARPAGAATLRDARTRVPFSHASANMPRDREMDFSVGKALFEKLWVEAPTVTTASDGLGPLFNGRSCNSCHINDGRGHPPESAEDFGVSMVLRLSVPEGQGALSPETVARIGVAPEPTYGTQLQDKSVAGLPAEGRVRVDYTSRPVTFGDGTLVELREPTYQIDRATYGPIHPDMMTSPRVAPPMIGLGLLEAIPEADILAMADPDDADGDGISGRANRVWSFEFNQWMLGRFGWKAGQPTLAQQSSDAFVNDIGISTPMHPTHWGNCTREQRGCRELPHGETGNEEKLEIPSIGMDLVTFYAGNLAVPARRDVDAPEVLRGKELFHATGCAACHQPKYVTHRLDDRPEQSFQLIWPYSDMLLHDMGDGLADNRPEFGASGREWRTPPLWGIGLTETVSGHTYFLHDGRARSLSEAILWHGGEGEGAREGFRVLPTDDRTALIAFLESL